MSPPAENIRALILSDDMTPCTAQSNYPTPYCLALHTEVDVFSNTLPWVTVFLIILIFRETAGMFQHRRVLESSI